MVTSQNVNTEPAVRPTKADQFANEITAAVETLRHRALLLESLGSSPEGDPQHRYQEGVRLLAEANTALQEHLESLTKLANSAPHPVSARRLALARGVSTNTMLNRLKRD